MFPRAMTYFKRRLSLLEPLTESQVDGLVLDDNFKKIKQVFIEDYVRMNGAQFKDVLLLANTVRELLNTMKFLSNFKELTFAELSLEKNGRFSKYWSKVVAMKNQEVINNSNPNALLTEEQLALFTKVPYADYFSDFVIRQYQYNGGSENSIEELRSQEDASALIITLLRKSGENKNKNTVFSEISAILFSSPMRGNLESASMKTLEVLETILPTNWRNIITGIVVVSSSGFKEMIEGSDQFQSLKSMIMKEYQQKSDQANTGLENCNTAVDLLAALEIMAAAEQGVQYLSAIFIRGNSVPSPARHVLTYLDIQLPLGWRNQIRSAAPKNLIKAAPTSRGGSIALIAIRNNQ